MLKEEAEMQAPTADKQAEINAAVAEVERLLAPDVVRIRSAFGEDWTGDPAIFFRVLLSDDAGSKARIREVAPRVRRTLADHLDFSALGVLPYHNFRSLSEHARLGEDTWG